MDGAASNIESARGRLLAVLPRLGTPALSLDDASRAALAMLLERGRDGMAIDRPSSTVSNCPNCGGPCDSERTPYCSDACKEQSAIVRQIRSNLASGAIFNEERQVAFGEKLWRILGGGYPRRTARLTEKQREKIFQREGGKCQLCGTPATVIDHCGSG